MKGARVFKGVIPAFIRSNILNFLLRSTFNYVFDVLTITHRPPCLPGDLLVAEAQWLSSNAAAASLVNLQLQKDVSLLI